MAGAITLGESGLKITKKEGDRKTSTTIGENIGVDITVGPVNVSLKSDGTIGGKISAGGFTVGADSKGGFTATTPVGGVSYNSDGSGEITMPFGVAKVEVERSGCTYILRTYIAGALTDTEYREIPDCKEPPPPPEPPPEPPPGPGSPPFVPFDPTTLPYSDDEIGFAVFSSLSYSEWGNNSEEKQTKISTNTVSPNAPYRFLESNFHREYISYGGYGGFYDITITRLFEGESKLSVTGTIRLPAYRGTPSYLQTNSYSETNPILIGSIDFTPLKFFVKRMYNLPLDIEYESFFGSSIEQGANNTQIVWQAEPRPYVFGRWKQIKEHIAYAQYKVSYSGGGVNMFQYTNVEFFTDRPKPGPYTGGGISMSDCCKEQKVNLARLEEALERLETVIGTRAILDDKDGYAVPNKMLIPGGDGYTYSKSYLGIFTSLFASIDRYGFDGPIVVDIPDVAKDKSGDQGIRIQVNSLSTAIQTLLSLAIENKGDASTRLNIQVRLAFMQTRMMRMTHKIYYLIVSILEGLGIPTIKKIIKGIPFEFNLNPEELGFGKKAEELDTMDENSLEAQLPKILDTKEVDLVVEAFKPNQLDLRGFLIKLINKQ